MYRCSGTRWRNTFCLVVDRIGIQPLIWDEPTFPSGENAGSQQTAAESWVCRSLACMDTSFVAQAKSSCLIYKILSVVYPPTAPIFWHRTWSFKAMDAYQELWFSYDKQFVRCSICSSVENSYIRAILTVIQWLDFVITYNLCKVKYEN